jgi:hypothetical protein
VGPFRSSGGDSKACRSPRAPLTVTVVVDPSRVAVSALFGTCSPAEAWTQDGVRVPVWVHPSAGLRRTGPGSVGAVDSDCKCGADLAHSSVAQSPRTADEGGNRDALDRVEVHRAMTRHRVVTRFEHDLADEAADRRCAWRHECAAMPRNHRVPRKDDDWSANDLGHLAPPDLPARWEVAHDAAAARRNDARSPHSSGSSSGCSSYAA